MPTMPPPKPPPKPGDPGHMTDANAEPGGFGVSKELALTALGVALFLASRGRLSEGTTKFVAKTAVGTLASTGALTLSRAAGHGDENAAKARYAAALRESLQKLQATVSPSNVYVTYVNKKTGDRLKIPIEELQRLIDTGAIRVKNAKTGEKVIKVEMKKPWLADP